LARRKIDTSGLLGLLRGADGYQAARPGTETHELVLDGRRTSMVVQLPESAARTRPGALIVLHGAGGSGAAMLPHFTGLGERLGMAVLCPDAQLLEQVSSNLDVSGVFAKHFRFPRWSFRSDDFPMAALRWALDRLDVDPDRCVLVGLSMGGLACWNLTMRAWQHFAAAVPINGALSMWEAFGSDRRTRYLLPNVTALPMFVVHGAMDDRISPEFDRRSVAELRSAGHRALSYVEVPDGSHPLSSLHFEDAGELVAQLEGWLAGCHRSTDPSFIRHRTLDDQHGRAHWVGLGQVDATTGAELVAERVQDDIFNLQVTGAGSVRLYLTSDRLEPGQPVTVLLNGQVFTVRFERSMASVVHTFSEHLDPALAAESVVTLAVPAPGDVANPERNEVPSDAVTS